MKRIIFIRRIYGLALIAFLAALLYPVCYPALFPRRHIPTAQERERAARRGADVLVSQYRRAGNRDLTAANYFRAQQTPDGVDRANEPQANFACGSFAF